MAQRKQRIDVVSPCLRVEEGLHLRQLLRIFIGKVVRLAVIVIEIVKLPRMRMSVEQLVGTVAWAADAVPRVPQQITRPPAIFIDSFVTVGLEVLNMVSAR